MMRVGGTLPTPHPSSCSHAMANKSSLGTSSVVVAAFVGPGTVLTCASAGVKFGYQLAWVLLFATAAVFVLQSFTASTGILARQGLGEALRNANAGPAFSVFARILVVLGLWIGCASFELGNLSGAAAGLANVVGADIQLKWFVLGLAIVAGFLLLLEVRFLIKLLSALVALMGVLFLLAVFCTRVDWSAAMQGLFVPSVPDGSILTVIALIGTTVVTYNLFLHASTTRDFWQSNPDARSSWKQELKGMAIFVPLGGLVSLAILFCGAALFGSDADFKKPGEFAGLLEPVAGSAARYLFGIGLLAAGLTSAITAPLAAAAGISELFDWKPNGPQFRLVWLSVLVTGVAFGLGGWSPLNVIIAAQAANGLLLPLVAGFMLYLAVRQDAVQLPKWYVGLGVAITLVCAGLGVKTLFWVAEKLNAKVEPIPARQTEEPQKAALTFPVGRPDENHWPRGA